MPHIIDTEPNNNTITSLTTPSSITGKLHTPQIDKNDSQSIRQPKTKNNLDSQVLNVSGLKGVYIQSDRYRPFTIFGKFLPFSFHFFLFLSFCQNTLFSIYYKNASKVPATL